MESLSKGEIESFALNALKNVASVALQYYGKGNPSVKFDHELVTSAEMVIDRQMRDEIRSSFPEAAIFGEGTKAVEYRHGEAGLMWVYDALDGVANFQAGIPMWGISLALVENFWPVFGAYFIPVTGDMFWAFADEKAYWNGKEICHEEGEPTNNESLLFTYSRFHDHFKTNFPGKIRNLGCSGAHICYVAAGRADGAVLYNVGFRDLIAPSIIVKSAGGYIGRVDGEPFYINDYIDGRGIKEFLLAARKDEHEQIRSYLVRIDFPEKDQV
ncbi:inositol monophosphatase family protein [Thermodesulforhabdus norvegica]|uniref:Myo-inositol-1(Or 4)-monophosphatase n=1 Tax=Thermodesulforhabdus norvegica TaxID=39841 RepID=A0A1I4RL08_9BACT|nr:inositol monophosphatase family protein [Thermodesulforhabdus norvegica]SFM52942.1 myo-inositol-1(or 4)-monophosphatase [Thermodesulforhabdus norvegica]